MTGSIEREAFKKCASLENSYVSISEEFGWTVEPPELFNKTGDEICRVYISGKPSANPNVRAKGRGNSLWVGFEADLGSTKFLISGTGNTIFIGPHVRLGGSDIRLKGNGATFYIGAFSTVQSMIAVVNDSGRVLIGDDCMLSARIILDNSDHHSIFDLDTGESINPDRDVVIHERVWLGRDIRLSKGVEILSDTVVGQGSLVSGRLQPTIVRSATWP